MEDCSLAELLGLYEYCHTGYYNFKTGEWFGLTFIQGNATIPVASSILFKVEAIRFSPYDAALSVRLLCFQERSGDCRRVENLPV